MHVDCPDIQERRILLCFSMPDCGSLILHKREARGEEAVIDRRSDGADDATRRTEITMRYLHASPTPVRSRLGIQIKGVEVFRSFEIKIVEIPIA